MPLNTIRHAIKNTIKYFDLIYTTTCASVKKCYPQSKLEKIIIFRTWPWVYHGIPYFQTNPYNINIQENATNLWHKIEPYEKHTL